MDQELAIERYSYVSDYIKFIKENCQTDDFIGLISHAYLDKDYITERLYPLLDSECVNVDESSIVMYTTRLELVRAEIAPKSLAQYVTWTPGSEYNDVLKYAAGVKFRADAVVKTLTEILVELYPFTQGEEVKVD